MGKKRGAGTHKAPTIAQKVSRLKVWQLVFGLLIVVGGTTLFIVLVSGGLGGNGPLAVLNEEYLCGDGCDEVYMDLTAEEYERLVADKKSFLVFVDQGGCTTADRLEGFLKDYATGKGARAYKIDFSDMKGTSMHEKVKYYPSVVVVSEGKIIGFLRADSDEDSDAYNKYEAFEAWMNKYLKF